MAQLCMYAGEDGGDITLYPLGGRVPVYGKEKKAKIACAWVQDQQVSWGGSLNTDKYCMSWYWLWIHIIDCEFILFVDFASEILICALQFSTLHHHLVHLAEIHNHTERKYFLVLKGSKKQLHNKR